MARSRSRRRTSSIAYTYHYRTAPKSRVYVATVPNYPQVLDSFRRTQIIGPSVRREKPRPTRARAKAPGPNTFKYDPGAQYLFGDAPKKRALVDPVKQRKLCKCTHERSPEQSRVSRKLFGRYGSRGLNTQTHICKC